MVSIYNIYTHTHFEYNIYIYIILCIYIYIYIHGSQYDDPCIDHLKCGPAAASIPCGGFHKWWNPKMDDLGVPLFQETTKLTNATRQPKSRDPQTRQGDAEVHLCVLQILKAFKSNTKRIPHNRSFLVYFEDGVPLSTQQSSPCLLKQWNLGVCPSFHTHNINTGIFVQIGYFFLRSLSSLTQHWICRKIRSELSLEDWQLG